MWRLFLIVALAGCSSEATPAARGCVAGSTKSCPCADGRTSAQACNASGTYDACACAVDAGVDTAPVTETGPELCDRAVASDYDCELPYHRAKPTHDCSEAQIQAMVKACIAAPLTTTPPGCAAWKSENAACAACIVDFSTATFGSRTIPSEVECYWAIFDDICDRAVQCSFDCQDDACAKCDDASGTGADGVGSAFDDCTARARSGKPAGVCWASSSKEAAECFGLEDWTVCRAGEAYTAKPDIAKVQTESIQFYRGACRDGGDWSERMSAGGG